MPRSALGFASVLALLAGTCAGENNCSSDDTVLLHHTAGHAWPYRRYPTITSHFARSLSLPRSRPPLLEASHASEILRDTEKVIDQTAIAQNRTKRTEDGLSEDGFGSSMIWCRNGIFCTSRPEDHGAGIRWSLENCHGYCFPTSCDSTWEDCVKQRNQQPPVCQAADATDCSVPFQNAPISDHQANVALDEIIANLADDMDAMILLSTHRPEILEAIKQGRDLTELGLPDYVLEPNEPPQTLQHISNNSTLHASAACVGQIVSVGVDSVMVISSFTRLGAAVNRTILTGNLAGVTTEETGFVHSFAGSGPTAGSARVAIDTIRGQASLWDKARSLIKLFMDLANAISIQNIVLAIRKSVRMGFWRWLRVAIQVVAQFLSWLIPPPGAALVAEAVTVIPNVAFLAADINELVKCLDR